MKNRKHNYTCFLFILAIFIGSCNRNIHQTALPIKDNIKMGAYYFDGWTGKTFHISPALDSFPERKPVWGWVTSTPSAITEQIDLAADAGISFFNFCWYYNKADG